jgi:hypothetical protein
VLVVRDAPLGAPLHSPEEAANRALRQSLEAYQELVEWVGATHERSSRLLPAAVPSFATTQVQLELAPALSVPSPCSRRPVQRRNAAYTGFEGLNSSANVVNDSKAAGQEAFCATSTITWPYSTMAAMVILCQRPCQSQVTSPPTR